MGYENMLRPEEIRVHRFTATNKGTYRPEEVDAYMEEVLASYEQMYRENGELVRKISLLAERVEEYRGDEDNIRAALLTAQRMADQIQKDANEQAAKQLAEARRAADDTTSQAQQTAKTLLDSAREKSQQVLSTAREESDRVLQEMEQRAQQILASADERAKQATKDGKRQNMLLTQTNDRMQEENAVFRAKLIRMYEEQLALIKSLPDTIAVQRPPEEEPQDAAQEVQSPEPPVVYEPVKTEDTPAFETITVDPQAEVVVPEDAESAEVQSPFRVAYETPEMFDAAYYEDSAQETEVPVEATAEESAPEAEAVSGGFRIQLENLGDLTPPQKPAEKAEEDPQ